MNRTAYYVMETFYSIQGEGFWSGTPAYFIRLAGCSVQCVWCDVKESWNKENYPRISAERLLQKTRKTPTKHVIITGGEPAEQDLSYLIELLQKNAYKVHLETSGAFPVRGNPDWITLSPKKFKPTLAENFRRADELKIIVYTKHDLRWAKQLQAKVSQNCLLYLQPEWSKKEKMQPLITEFIKENPEWKISLQIHKYLGIE